MPKTENLTRETLRKMSVNSKVSKLKQELAELRVAYSEDSKLLTSYVNKLINVNRLYLTHLPTQTSGRWSTWITNWPRACVNPSCQNSLTYNEHEWSDNCWSIRDILKADKDEVLITWDHDNIEGRIYDLVVADEVAIEAHREGYDLHTITCCDIFNMEYPQDRRNPHQSNIDEEWRMRYNWQGKDTRKRVLAKNFNHGSKYTESYRFVHKIPGIEKYGVTYRDLEQLAKEYIASKGDSWLRKLDLMKKIRKDRMARTLYGFRRVFFDSSAETGRKGLSHMISGTASDFNNETLRLLEERYGDNIRLAHNAHDGDKMCLKRSAYSKEETFKEVKSIIEREVDYNDNSLVLTAGIKIYE